MDAVKSGLLIFSSFLSNSTKCTVCGFQQVRNKKYFGRWLMRDIKRRKLAKDYADERLRLLALKRNDILPKAFKNIVDKEFDEKIPRQTALRQLTPRCSITSRGHGVVYRWRLSRIMFRHLADYNKLSGVQRAIW